MKKLSFLILMVFLFSCEKPKEIEDKSEVQKFCWTCEFSYPNFQGHGFHAEKKDVCDKTEDEIRSYEKVNSWKCGCVGDINSHTVTCWRKY
jgi:hypothetical protein